jgi:MscS family membrane protein
VTGAESSGEYALKLFLYVFTVGTTYADYMRVKQDLLLKLAAIVAEHDAQLALPVSNVYLPEGLAIEREYAHGAGGGTPRAAPGDGHV